MFVGWFKASHTSEGRVQGGQSNREERLKQTFVSKSTEGWDYRTEAQHTAEGSGQKGSVISQSSECKGYLAAKPLTERVMNAAHIQ